MYKTTLTFENFEGQEITKTLYFNLTQAEIVDMEFNDPNGSVLTMLRKMANEKDMRLIVPLIKRFMLMSYCERTEDGSLIKNELIKEKFASSAEYSELYMQFVSDVELFATFVNNIVPKSAQKNIEQMKKYDGEKIEKYIKTGDYSVFSQSDETDKADLKVVEATEGEKKDASEDNNTSNK